MFLSSMSSNSIATKAKSMYGKRLTADQYKDLTHRESVTDVALYLKENTYYKSVLDQVDIYNIHRGQLESILAKDLFNRYTKLCRYNFSGDNSFYNYLIIQYEIEQLLKCILSLNSNTMETFIVDLPAFMISRASFDMLALAKVRSFEDLLEVLHHTPYRDVLKKFAPKSGELIDYLSCEQALMTFHYEHLLKLIDTQFRGRAKKDLDRVIKINVTLTNLMTVYRLKRYFEASPEEIRNVLLPISFRLNKVILEKMIYSGSVEEFFDLFHSCYYGKIEEENDAEFGQFLDQIIFNYNKRLMRFSTSAPAVLYAFILLNQAEINNIIKIVEGTRYQVSPSEIESMLIM